MLVEFLGITFALFILLSLACYYTKAEIEARTSELNRALGLSEDAEHRARVFRAATLRAKREETGIRSHNCENKLFEYEELIHKWADISCHTCICKLVREKSREIEAVKPR